MKTFYLKIQASDDVAGYFEGIFTDTVLNVLISDILAKGIPTSAETNVTVERFNPTSL